VAQLSINIWSGAVLISGVKWRMKTQIQLFSPKHFKIRHGNYFFLLCNPKVFTGFLFSVEHFFQVNNVTWKSILKTILPIAVFSCYGCHHMSSSFCLYVFFHWLMFNQDASYRNLLVPTSICYINGIDHSRLNPFFIVCDLSSWFQLK